MSTAKRNKLFSPDLLRDLHAEPALRPLRTDEVETVSEGRELMPLSGHENDRLLECEQVIARGLNTFVEVGQALAEIRNRRLYRGEYRTFEAYCSERYGLKRQRAYEMMGASEVTMNLSEISDILPSKESHAASLLKLAPADQRETWQEIINETPDVTTITAKQIKRKVSERLRRQNETEEERSEQADMQERDELTRPLGRAMRSQPEQVMITITGSWLVKNNLEHAWRELRGVSRSIDQNFTDVITLGEAFELGLLKPIK